MDGWMDRLMDITLGRSQCSPFCDFQALTLGDGVTWLWQSEAGGRVTWEGFILCTDLFSPFLQDAFPLSPQSGTCYHNSNLFSLLLSESENHKPPSSKLGGAPKYYCLLLFNHWDG